MSTHALQQEQQRKIPAKTLKRALLSFVKKTTHTADESPPYWLLVYFLDYLASWSVDVDDVDVTESSFY